MLDVALRVMLVGLLCGQSSWSCGDDTCDVSSVEMRQHYMLTTFSVACPESGRPQFNSFPRMRGLKLVSLSSGCGIFSKSHLVHS